MKSKKLTAIAASLIALQLILRGWVAWRGGFYWDDLVLAGRSSMSPIWSANYLFQHHDGHFMPAAFLVAGVTTKLAPLRWAPVFVELLLLQALASLAVFRLLRLILGARFITAVLFAGFLFTPLTLPSSTWWSAALNALPLHAGLAWTSGEMILLVRTERRRHAITAALGFAAALLFFEKSLVIPFAATTITALSLLVTNHHSPLRTTLRRSRGLWAGYALVIVAWLALYCSSSPPLLYLPSPSTAAEALWRTNAQGLVPALFGGPLAWLRWPPTSAFAHPPALFVLLAAAIGLALLAVTLRRIAHAGPVWLLFFGYLAVCEAAMLVGRLGPEADGTLGLTLRYIADSAVVFAATLALLARSARIRVLPRSARALVAAACCLGLFSTATYAEVWADNPTNAYLDTARRALAADRSAPLLDQAVPFTLLSRLNYPDNLASHVLGPLRERPRFATSTTALRVLDNQGRLVPGQLTYVTAIPQGPIRDCGYRMTVQTPDIAPLTRPVIDWEWTVQLNYFASEDGLIDIGFTGGRTVSAPVTGGLHNVFVRLGGGGKALVIRPSTPGLAICVGAGAVGQAWPK